jgi:hypothetical protein
MQTSLSAPAPPTPLTAMQCMHVQLTPIEGGRVYVAIGATLCEAVGDDDFELVSMDLASERVDTIDQAIAVIREAVVSSMPN